MDTSLEGPIGLGEFLEEAELQQYIDSFRDTLKITKITQLKFVRHDDLTELGMSKPEQRRYKKIYAKYFGKQYFTIIKKLLSSTRRNDLNVENATNTTEPPVLNETQFKVPTKHIISMEDITINKELGTGEFGVVQQGTWTNDNKRIQVAIKCLGRDRMHSNSMEFLKEAAVMHSIDHPSVVRLYGVVLHTDSLMLVTELAPLRSLLECLKEFTLRQSFPVLNLCYFAEQICDGMTYLEKKRLIHRDLAARNILVFNKNKVKISDFGLSRALGVGKDYYQTNYNVDLKLPVAWCAAECITYLRFTSASDVWAYAVTLWEMFSYGFQPWAAFSGHQILTAIDEPNLQRLEKPECCPDEYYDLMLECWAHEPGDRPTFKEIGQRLPGLRPQQLVANTSFPKVNGRRNLLSYRAGDLITVIGKETVTKSEMWYGVLANGGCGLFDPSNMTVHVSASPTMLGTPGGSKGPGLTATLRSSLLRSDSKRHTYTAKRNIQRIMISGPQGEVKHTGHVGLDGAYFGDVSFLDPANGIDPPRQIVYPYRPSEDLEEMPLINPSSPSHLTAEAASLPYPMISTNHQHPTITPALDRHHQDEVDDAGAGSGAYSKTGKRHAKGSGKKFISRVKSATLGKSFRVDEIANLPSTSKSGEAAHEYHEISDHESLAADHVPPESPGLHKSPTDFGQSLLQEMETLFQGLSVPGDSQPYRKSETMNRRASTLGKRKPHLTEIVKPMSAHEQKTLETAVALANELTTKSMNDLDSKPEKLPNSPTERNKFHFKFPSLVSHQHPSLEHVKDSQGKAERRNFSQEAQSVSDLQSTITEESRIAYASLIENPMPSSSLISQISQVGNLLYNHSHAHAHKSRNQQPPINHTRPISSSSIDNDGRPPCYDSQPVQRPPLPPKGDKPPLVDKTRHQRKYPLVMTESTRMHLDPVPITGRLEDRNGCSLNLLTETHDYQNCLDSQPDDFGKANRMYVNNSNQCKSIDHNTYLPERIYQNIPMAGDSGVDVFDGPSLNFEKNIGPEVSKEKPKIKERAKSTNEEVASIQAYKEGILIKDSPDHVSVEDLLEFADHRPSGQTRGTESDEVRIMCKVLRDKASEAECLEALELSEWNVHVSLKLIRLRLVVKEEATLEECSRALSACGGDLTRAIAFVQKSNVDNGVSY